MLKLNSLTKSFGTQKVLDNISLTFNFGITGIAGSNGCGKTTMLKIMTGLLNQDGGTIENNAEEIDTKSSTWRSKIGYLPQTIGLYNRMSVFDFLDYMLVLSGNKDSGVRKERIEYLTGELNLANYLNIPCGTLSGGVKQRTGIAQALIHDPEIVFFDEPTNNLDAEERERFHNFLNKIKQEKIILYVGHILGELGSVSDQLVIFKNGGILFNGTPFEFLNEPGCLLKQIVLDDKTVPEFIKERDILSIVEENRKLKIIYKAEPDDETGTAVEPRYEDIYKILTRE